MNRGPPRRHRVTDCGAGLILSRVAEPRLRALQGIGEPSSPAAFPGWWVGARGSGRYRAEHRVEIALTGCFHTSGRFPPLISAASKRHCRAIQQRDVSVPTVVTG